MATLVEIDVGGQTLRYSDFDGLVVDNKPYPFRLLQSSRIENSLGSAHNPRNTQGATSLLFEDGITNPPFQRFRELAKEHDNLSKATFRVYGKKAVRSNRKRDYALLYTGQVATRNGLAFDKNLCKINLVPTPTRRNTGIPNSRLTSGSMPYQPRIFGDYTAAPEMFVPTVKLEPRMFLLCHPDDYTSIAKVSTRADGSAILASTGWAYDNGRITIDTGQPDQDELYVSGVFGKWGTNGRSPYHMALWLILNVIGDNSQTHTQAKVTGTKSPASITITSANDELGVEARDENGVVRVETVTFSAGAMTIQQISTRFNAQTLATTVKSRVVDGKLELYSVQKGSSEYLEVDTVGGGQALAAALGLGTDGTLKKVYGTTYYDRLDNAAFDAFRDEVASYNVRYYYGEQDASKQPEAQDELRRLLNGAWYDLKITRAGLYSPIRRSFLISGPRRRITEPDLSVKNNRLPTYKLSNDPQGITYNVLHIAYGTNPATGSTTLAYEGKDSTSIANLGYEREFSLRVPYFYESAGPQNVASLWLQIFSESAYELDFELDGLYEIEPGDEVEFEYDQINDERYQVRGVAWDLKMNATALKTRELALILVKIFGPANLPNYDQATQEQKDKYIYLKTGVPVLTAGGSYSMNYADVSTFSEGDDLPAATMNQLDANIESNRKGLFRFPAGGSDFFGAVFSYEEVDGDKIPKIIMKLNTDPSAITESNREFEFFADDVREESPSI